jgi:hypothetical protein
LLLHPLLPLLLFAFQLRLPWWLHRLLLLLLHWIPLHLLFVVASAAYGISFRCICFCTCVVCCIWLQLRLPLWLYQLLLLLLR